MISGTFCSTRSISFSLTKKGFSPFVVKKRGLLSGNASIQSDLDEPLSATKIIFQFSPQSKKRVSNLRKNSENTRCFSFCPRQALQDQPTPSIHYKRSRNLLQGDFCHFGLVQGRTVTGTCIYKIALCFAELKRSNAAQLEFFKSNVQVFLCNVTIGFFQTHQFQIGGIGTDRKS